MNEIYLRKCPDGRFETTNHNDFIIVQEDFKNGEIYKHCITKPRKYNSLGKYRLLLRAIAYHRGFDEEYWHDFFLCIRFGYEEKSNFITGEKVRRPLGRTNFERLDEIGFRNYLTFVFEKLIEFDLDGEQLISDYKNNIAMR
jgi:hypothetical protein